MDWDGRASNTIRATNARNWIVIEKQNTEYLWAICTNDDYIATFAFKHPINSPRCTPTWDQLLPFFPLQTFVNNLVLIILFISSSIKLSQRSHKYKWNEINSFTFNYTADSDISFSMGHFALMNAVSSAYDAYTLFFPPLTYIFRSLARFPNDECILFIQFCCVLPWKLINFCPKHSINPIIMQCNNVSNENQITNFQRAFFNQFGLDFLIALIIHMQEAIKSIISWKNQISKSVNYSFFRTSINWNM